jgi:uncharacterized protein
MARPPRERIVAGTPAVTVYKPAGVPARELQWTQLALDEFEAVRLIDGEGLDQETAAGRMGVSRPTVTRILASARAKIAQVLIHGQALVIQGGPVIPPPGAYPGGGHGQGGRGQGHGRRGRRWK